MVQVKCVRGTQLHAIFKEAKAFKQTESTQTNLLLFIKAKADSVGANLRQAGRFMLCVLHCRGSASTDCPATEAHCIYEKTVENSDCLSCLQVFSCSHRNTHKEQLWVVQEVLCGGLLFAPSVYPQTALHRTGGGCCGCMQHTHYCGPLRSWVGLLIRVTCLFILSFFLSLSFLCICVSSSMLS